MTGFLCTCFLLLPTLVASTDCGTEGTCDEDDVQSVSLLQHGVALKSGSKPSVRQSMLKGERQGAKANRTQERTVTIYNEGNDNCIKAYWDASETGKYLFEGSTCGTGSLKKFIITDESSDACPIASANDDFSDCYCTIRMFSDETQYMDLKSGEYHNGNKARIIAASSTSVKKLRIDPGGRRRSARRRQYVKILTADSDPAWAFGWEQDLWYDGFMFASKTINTNNNWVFYEDGTDQLEGADFKCYRSDQDNYP